MELESVNGKCEFSRRVEIIRHILVNYKGILFKVISTYHWMIALLEHEEYWNTHPLYDLIISFRKEIIKVRKEEWN